MIAVAHGQDAANLPTEMSENNNNVENNLSHAMMMMGGGDHQHMMFNAGGEGIFDMSSLNNSRIPGKISKLK